MDQNLAFRTGEADRYFERNAVTASSGTYDECVEALASAGLAPQMSVLEVGCCDGRRLRRLADQFQIKPFGVELSRRGCEAAEARGVRVLCDDAAEFDFGRRFDVILLPFVLHWIDRRHLLRTVCNVDRHLTWQGLLVINDFWHERFARVAYHHAPDGIWTFKQDYHRIFVATGLYTVLRHNVYSYSRHGHADALDTPPTGVSDQACLSVLQKREDLFELQDRDAP